MKANRIPVVKEQILTWYEEANQHQLMVGSAAWYTWLEHASRFSFEGKEGSFTARKEPGQHGGMYWKAYRKAAGKLRRIYLGKSEALTHELLSTVATRFSGQQTREPSSLIPHQKSWSKHQLTAPAFPSNMSKPTFSGASALDLNIGRPLSPSKTPLPLTRLLGREQELAEGCRLLRQTVVRLLTLTGTGGVGKTRLAIEIAAMLQSDFADGVHFVQLASIQDPAFVLPTIARGFQFQGSGTTSPLEFLQTTLHNRHMLLVLDNFEQVIEAAPLLVELLTFCQSLKIMLTSREPLHVRGERLLSLQPLALPHAEAFGNQETFASYGAITLFVERAQEILPAFQLTSENAPLVAEICQRLDGLPLALELAAARLKLFSLHELLERLEKQRLALLADGPRDVPARQQTLRATLQWSYNLLSPAEQHLFRLLASFANGCTLSALEAISYTLGDQAASPLEAVTSLLNKHLLYQREQDHGERRLLMLETIREYGWECLLACHELEEVREAQARYYVHLTEEAASSTGEVQERWFDRIEWERDNLRVLLKWLVERGEQGQGIEMALRLAGAVAQFWTLRWYHWYVSEERYWVERALTNNTEVAPIIKAKALQAAAWLAVAQDDARRAEELYQKSLERYRKANAKAGLAPAYHWLGYLAWNAQRDSSKAQALLAECYKFAEDDKTLLALAHTTSGNMAIDQGNSDVAQEHLEQSLILCKASQNKKNLARALRGLGRVRLAQGDIAAGYALIEESLAYCRKTKNRLHQAYALDLLGRIACFQNDLASARAFLEEGLATLRILGIQRHCAYALAHLAHVAMLQGDIEAAHQLFTESLTQLYRLADYAGVATCLQRWGTILARQGSLQEATQLWGYAEVRRQAAKPHHFALPIEHIHFEQQDYELSHSEVRRQLGRQAFNSAWAEGQKLTLEQVLVLGKYPSPIHQAHGDANNQAEPNTFKQPASTTHIDALTSREIEVLRLVAKGYTDAQVADALIISPRTVHAHLRSIYNKLGISSRFAAIHYAHTAHLL
ncbi:hypothetical protein EPA93_16600 [Ktedonosporobacter rubrisoli]|uniref:HTH luxR-type domain-containing protein n=1 Tax=Ktedonosporobacter rubrisoli TaxID=2509675 RepID=A0A4P6JQT4_KTERU|nr:LuxR C-terminal-related transcriptional regulator [Ktedonosporobacter rubrisoli]QBD77522.1 hypothetical protein EPA93_16600 [Ktedonosporobacter rubrisoli]